MSDQEQKEPTSAEKAAEAIVGKPADEEAAPVEEPTEKPEAEPKAEEQKPEPPADERLVKDDGKPYTKADIDGLQTALKAARKDAKDHKTTLDALTAKTGDRTIEQIEQEANTAAEQRWRPRLVAASARAALTEAGLVLPEKREAEAMARAIRLLDVDALTIEDDGAVKGLAEQVEALRGDFPDLFATAQQRRPRIQAADRPGGPKPPVATADRLAAQLLGRS